MTSERKANVLIILSSIFHVPPVMSSFVQVGLFLSIPVADNLIALKAL